MKGCCISSESTPRLRDEGGRTLAGRDQGKNRDMDDYNWDGSEKRVSSRNCKELGLGNHAMGEKDPYGW